jgi:L-cysteine:1D-myo-inositol 2-amino-2-deoxy-alpha-D-glucopyranoside ligase
MSKSKGNLVFVNELRRSEVDPAAIRLSLLRHHYREDWEWTSENLWAAQDTLERWRDALRHGVGAPAGPVVEQVLAAIAEDLDAPTAVAAVDAWAAATTGGDHKDIYAADQIRAVLDAALGLKL